MKAAVFDEYGPPEVLHLAELPVPVPGDHEVLVRVHATTVNFGDTLVRGFDEVTPRRFNMPFLFWLIGRTQFGWRRPRTRVLGNEFAGEVTAVGRDVTRYAVGDRVFGYRGSRMGVYAEHLCVPERSVMSRMPANLTFEEAAAVPYGAIMAWGLLRKIRVQPGQRVLVVGASGGIGAAVVQLATAELGVWVTGVCGTSSLDQVRALGAEEVIDHTQEDFADRGETYDVIINVLGTRTFADCRRALVAGGRLVCFSFKSRQILEMLWTSVFGRQKVRCVLVSEKPEDLEDIRRFVETGTLRVFVDRVFSLAEAADAHRYAADDRRTGAVVIAVR